MRHWKYLKYVVRHKWYVLLACIRLAFAEKSPLLIWRGLVHDFSKFRPSEWMPYATFFYANPKQELREDAVRMLGYDPYPPVWEIKLNFLRAWNYHQKRNDHHWQYWMLQNDDGSHSLICPPKIAILEMVADWEGAGLAITGKKDVLGWYTKNRGLIKLHADARDLVERLISYQPTYGL